MLPAGPDFQCGIMVQLSCKVKDETSNSVEKSICCLADHYMLQQAANTSFLALEDSCSFPDRTKTVVRIIMTG